MNTRPILLDCDPGVDDAMAILYALGAGGSFAAVGSVHGNVPAPLAAANALRILAAGDAADVPVAVGAHRPLAQPLKTAESVHGDDGLGNTWMPAAPGQPRPGSAAQQIVDQAHAHPGELVLVATGPLTNLALALLLDPELPSLIPEVVVMGGAVQLPGNITPFAEANIWHDPEAAELVIDASWQVTMATLDATMRTILTPAHLSSLEGSSSRGGRFVWAVLQHYLGFYEKTLGVHSCPLHDPLALALALHPELATYRTLPTRVELRGEHTRGATVCDLRTGEQAPSEQSWHPVRYIDELDVERFQAMFVQALTG